MPVAKCPECSEEVFVEADMEQGEFVECEECGMTLELVGLDPIELDARRIEDLDKTDDGFGFDEDNGY